MMIPSTNSRGVLCAGSIVFDTIVRAFDQPRWGTTTLVESIDCRVGGNAANTARALGILGVPVRLVGALGSDEPARFIRRALDQSAVDTSAMVTLELPTAASVVLVNAAGDRQFLHRLGTSAEVFAQPLEFSPLLCDGISHFHLASMFVIPNLRANGAAMLANARLVGLTTSFDTNWDAHGEWMQALEPCLPHLDYLFMNEDEARMITGSSDPDVAAEAVLSRGVRTAVLKLSGRGCAVYTQDSRIVCPAFKVEAQDTTGAGDCFVAGFIAARMEGASLAKAGRFANAVAALSVGKIGATEGVLPVAEVEAWMLTTPFRPDV